MTKDYFKRLTSVNYTSWDLNAKECVIIKPSKKRKLKKMFNRTARHKDKNFLKKCLDK